MKKKNKKLDIFLLILFPIIAVFISILFKTNFLISTLLLFSPQAIWLSFKHKRAIKKTFIYSVIFSVPATIFLDYIMYTSQTWHIVDSIFSFRLLDVIAIEQFIWGFLCTYIVVIFYEYFFDSKSRKSLFSFLKFKKEKSIEKKMWYLVTFLIILVLIVLISFFTAPDLFKIKYLYLIFGTLLMIFPLVICLSLFPNLLVKFIKTSLYFSFLAILVEITGIYLNHWIFPSQNFIGWVTVLEYTIPLEEVILYLILSTAGLLSYYEFFDDDRK